MATTQKPLATVLWLLAFSTISISAWGDAAPAPENLTAVAISTSQVDLSWTYPAIEVKAFKVYQSLDGISFKKVGKLKTNITAFSVLNLNPDCLYYYRIRAVTPAGKSDYSNVANTRTQPIIQGGPKVFPGAVGFGTDTPAGRGGVVLKVTNLNDSGPGSLREAVETSGPRIVVFEISGTIQLLSELDILNPNLTIAGQTAPSPGITLRAAEFNINTHDVLLQHIRIRVGDELPAGTDPDSLDGLSSNGSYEGGAGSYNVVMDHVSVSWGIDENTGGWGENIHDITFGHCIISEALYHSLHSKGAHSMGMLMAPNALNVSILNNLFVHNADRNPLISVGGSVVIANNVFYNWMGGRATGIGNAVPDYPALYPTLVSVVQNVYIGGPDTTTSTNAISTTTNLNPGSMIYYSGNSLENVAYEFRNVAPFDPVVATPPIWIPGYTAAATDTVLGSVLLDAGARPLDRDAVDVRITNDVIQRTGAIIDSQSQVGGWPDLTVNTRTLIIPDNPGGDDDGDGYTNIEEELLIPMAQLLEN